MSLLNTPNMGRVRSGGKLPRTEGFVQLNDKLLNGGKQWLKRSPVSE